MANISKLSTVVTANASQYDTVMEKVKKRYDRLQEHFNKKGGKGGQSFQDFLGKDKVFGKMLGGKGGGFGKGGAMAGMKPLLQGATKLKGLWVALLAVLAALGVGFAAHYIVKVAGAAIETYKFSKTVGDTAANIFALQQAFRSVNVDADLVNSTIEDLGKTLQSGLSGDIAINDVFKRLRLDVGELANMKPTDAFAVIAEAIRKIPDDATRGAIAFQIFGDKAKDILPVIMLGQKGLSKAADEAKRMGMNLSQLQLAKIQEGKVAFEKLEAICTGLAMQFLAELAPALVTLIRLFEDMHGMGGNLNGVFSVLKDVFISFAVSAYNTVLTTRIALLYLKDGILGIGLAVTYVIQEMFGMLAVAVKVVAPKLGNELLKIAKKIVKMRGDVFSEIENDVDTANSLSNDIINEKDFKRKMRSVRDEWKNTQKDLQKTAKSQTSANLNSGLFDEAKNVIKETATPLEKYQSELTKLDRMLATGAISWSVYGRAVSKATNELEQALQTQSVQLPTVAKRDSSEAVSAVNKARLENDLKNKETPQQRIERLTKEGLAVQSRIEEHTKRMADAASKRVIVTMK